MTFFSCCNHIRQLSQLLADFLALMSKSILENKFVFSVSNTKYCIINRSLAASWFDSALNPWSSRSGLSLGQEHCNFVFLDKTLGSKWKKQSRVTKLYHWQLQKLYMKRSRIFLLKKPNPSPGTKHSLCLSSAKKIHSSFIIEL